MKPFCLLVALLAIQSAKVYGEDEVSEGHQSQDQHIAQMDFLDMFFGPHSHVFPSSSTAKMAQVAKSDKTAEEQLEDIKGIANEITMAIQSEMANLLTFALANCDKEVKENGLRKKRETPQDSTELVMRLLKHIKANNEFQNIAIEKMMSAQEIAQKFGIDFPEPDTDTLFDMAFAANEQAKDLTDIVKGSVDNSTITKQTQLKPVEINEIPHSKSHPDQKPYSEPKHNARHQNTHHHHHNYPQQPQHFETQVVKPPVQQQQISAQNHQAPQPVSQRPQAYGPSMPIPENDFFPQCPQFEPYTTTTTIIIPIEEISEVEPEIIGEEYEETITSKVYIDHEDSDGATVNHVMTYTVSEKAHFRTPKVEQLPQQMQYYFFL